MNVPASIKSFKNCDTCPASSVLEEQGSIARSDFGHATKYLFALAKRTANEDVFSEDLQGQVERQFDLDSGVGQLAWQCARAQADEICLKTKEE